MRLVMTLVVRNEEELVAANFDFHLAMGVDLILVSDHGSSDATPEILERYERRGVARVFHRRDELFNQSAWMTEMSTLACTEHGADWVLNNDADEFWWPVAGTLKDVLGAVPERYGTLAVPRNDFLPRPGDGSFWERMVVRETRSRNLVGDDLEPNAVHRGRPDVTVEQGNHRVSAPGLVGAPAIPAIEVAHYPIRTYEQFERKVVMQGVNYTEMPGRPPEMGRDQLVLYEIYQRGELRAHFETALCEDSRLAAGVQRGELVVDRRLERFMRALERGEDPLPDRAPQGAAVRRLVAAALGLAERAEDAEARLADTAAELAATRGRLDETSISLELLRNSRLQRWTRGPRRALYRARGRR